MKLKLRKLRKKREMVAHWKGGFSKSYSYRKSRLIVRRRRTKTNLKLNDNDSVIALFVYHNKLKSYYKFKLVPKSKKRGGKNR